MKNISCPLGAFFDFMEKSKKYPKIFHSNALRIFKLKLQ